MRKRTCIIAALSALACLPVYAASTKPLLPLPTPTTNLTAPADPGHFTFVVAGDNRSTGHGYPMPKVLGVICGEIGMLRPDFVFWTGDVIEGYGDTVAEAGAEYDTFLASVALTDVPVFNAPGNHEYSTDPALMPVYEKRMGPLYGSFDYGNSHFIGLDTTPLMPEGTLVGGTLDDAQWSWLEADLKANQDAKNIFVMMHHYVFGPPDPATPDSDTGWRSVADRDRLHALMVKYHVRAVFCSHDHLYWHGVKDGIDYYITGGAGAPLDATPDKGGFLHYLLIDVDGTQVTPQIFQPWHLEVNYPDGDGGGATTERAWVSNTNDFPVTTKHIVFHMASLPAGQTWAVTAGTAYKKKTESVPAQIVSVTPVGTGVEVVATVTAAPARTTEISVHPATTITK
jgi:hypothetical protein